MSSSKDTKLQKYSAPALEKGLDILEFLSLSSGEPNLSQLAAGIGRSKNEIFRMMIVLEERGYIERLDGDYFTLTDKLARVGGVRSDLARLAELAHPYLTDLSEQTSLSNSLSVWRDGRLLTVAAAESAGTYGLNVRVGHQHAVFGTASGACFFASEIENPDALSSAAVGQSETAKAEFLTLIDQCRREGVVEAPNPEHNAILELATPVRQAAQNKTIAAISISIIKSVESPNRIVDVKTSLLRLTNSLQEKLLLTFPDQLNLESG